MFIQSKTHNVILTAVICVASAVIILLWRSLSQAQDNEAIAKAEVQHEKFRAESAEADTRHAKSLLKIEQDKSARLANELIETKAGVKNMGVTLEKLRVSLSTLEEQNHKQTKLNQDIMKRGDKYIQVSDLIVKNFDKIPDSITDKFIEIQRK